MESPAHSPAPARILRGRALRPRPRPFALLLALGAALPLLGCGAAEEHAPSSSYLVVGERAAPVPLAQLASAAQLAERFARAYARTVYLARPPSLPGASAALSRDLRAGAHRVPVARRRLHPRLADLHLSIASAGRLDASLLVVDNHSPMFSVGFSLARRAGGWRVVSISAPE